ncbi:MAG: VOC family protein [Planctomycetes bacterium]|nr:VOC family protein [Planctomycetota bacterium]
MRSIFLPTLLLAGAAALAAAFVPATSHQAPPAVTKPSPAASPSEFVPCLWFDEEAEAAVRHYASVFEGARITSEMRSGGALISAKLAWRGHDLIVLNGNTKHAFNASASIVVSCKDQREIDRYWDGLVAGGTPTMCGWLEDRFGVSWQVIPESLSALLGDPDPAKARRVAEAMFQMQKLDLAALERARDGR